MGFLDRLTWKEYFLIGGLMVIWALVAYAGINALTTSNIETFGLAVFIGIIGTGILFILIAVIDRIF
ncbi:MAG: hypothetical protein ACXAC6_08270 [Candidatus Hodarchaeales archaeon]|jgi:hypothetical protein